MTSSADRSTRRRPIVRLVATIALVLGAAASAAALFAAEPPPQPHPASRMPAEQGLRWHEMKPAQQEALKPLEHEWPSIESSRKQKWLELSGRFPKMSPSEQARVQERMAEWARLTPQQRGDARLHFQQAKQMPAAERQARWDAYKALSPEQKEEFAARAGRPAPFVARGASATGSSRGTLPSAAAATGPRVIGPTIVQARPGVTTTSIARRPAPPSHQQAGSPVIAATPELVNKSTLLPKHGPQGPVTRPPAAAASEPTASQ